MNKINIEGIKQVIAALRLAETGQLPVRANILRTLRCDSVDVPRRGVMSDLLRNECRTMACIAGITVLTLLPTSRYIIGRVDSYVVRPDDTMDLVTDMAADVLGLDAGEAEYLFFKSVNHVWGPPSQQARQMITILECIVDGMSVEDAVLSLKKQHNMV